MRSLRLGLLRRVVVWVVLLQRCRLPLGGVLLPEVGTGRRVALVGSLLRWRLSRSRSRGPASGWEEEARASPHAGAMGLGLGRRRGS